MSKLIQGALICILTGFFAGHFITRNFLSEIIPDGYVRVTVNNKSGHTIKTLTLKHESGSIEMEDLLDTETVNLIFKNSGENSYRIIATLDNDSTIYSTGEYVEAGYRTIETVSADKIRKERENY